MPQVPIERERLDNGLRVILSEDRRTPIVGVNLWYDVGSRNEERGRTGFAHLFEHMMFQGSANVAKGEHFALIQAAGGTLNASTWTDRTNYFETLPSHELELALWLESDRMASLLPAMTQEKLDNQRDVVKNERRLSVDNQPYGTAEERMQALMWPEGHPYHHSTIGSMEDLSAASMDDVSRFFATYYAPNNAVLTVAGDFDRDAAMARIERHFGPIPANPTLPAPPSGDVPDSLGGEVREVVADQVELPRIHLAYRIPPFGTDAHEAFNILSDVLGTGRASRLYRSLVRERQLAADVAAFVFPWAHGSTALGIWATARPEVSVETLEAQLLAEIDQLSTDGPTDEELARVRTLHAAAVEAGLEQIGERADRISQYACLFDKPDMVNTEVARYDALTAADIRAALGDRISADNRLVLTYVPDEDQTEDGEAAA
ncbi:MAG TPA: pitrilysin family protein [Candidatus Limnocylindria bacterium]|jgi:predicted Zn-dependent peptidase|nr:pitrilysin family protein [Candidatus Limnocylindria bacterium]